MSWASGLAEIFIVALSANLLGGFLTKLFFKNARLWNDTVLEELTRLGLGLVVISYLLWLAVEIRAVNSGLMWGFLGLLTLLTLWRLKQLGPGIVARMRKPGFLRDPAVIVLILYFALMTFLAILPAAGRDELLYHLEVPRRFLAAHGDTLFRDNIYAYFPKLTEMFYVLGLGTVGEAAAKMFHVLFGFLTALALYRSALTWLGRTHARWAAALFLGIPSVMAIMPMAYVDLAFVFFVLMAILHVLAFIREKALRQAVPAGIFLGAAIAVKYTGLQMTALVLCLLAVAWIKDRTLPLLRPAGIIAGLAFVVALPYFVRNLLHTGWPLFPFAMPGFSLKPGFNWDPERARLFMQYLESFGALPGLSGIGQVLAAPFAVFVVGRFDQPAFYDGIIGPIFLLIPFLIFRKKMAPELRAAGWFVISYLFYWAVTTRQVRFLLPIAPLLCLFLALGLKEQRKKWPAVLAGILLAVNVVLGMGEILKLDPLGYWFGRGSREAYLQEHIPGYPMYAAADRLMGPGDKAYLVHMKNYGYCLDKPWEGDFIFERFRLEAQLNRDPSPEGLEYFFKQKHITHLMVNSGPLAHPSLGLNAESRQAFFRFVEQKTKTLLKQGDYGLFRLN